MNEQEELVIDQSNFDNYFFDVRKHSPKKNQIMARYLAKADLLSSTEKGYIIDMLISNPKGAEMSVQMMGKMFSSKEIDAIEICKAMTQDLIGGMTRQEVLDKPYRFTIEMFFWTQEEYVPKDDPHWKAIKVTMLNQKGEIEQ